MHRLLALFFTLVFTFAIIPGDAHAGGLRSPFTKIKKDESGTFNNLADDSRNIWNSKKGKKWKDLSRSDVDDLRTQGEEIAGTAKKTGKKYANKYKNKKNKYMRGRRGAPSTGGSSSSGYNN